MKTYPFLTGFTLCFICISASTNAQQTESPYFKQQQIIIQQNGNNRESFSIEMNGDQVYINGVPADQYKDSNITIKSNRPIHSGMSKIFDTDEGFGRDWGDRNKMPLGMKLADSAGMSGVFVLEVAPGSPAEKAGILQADLLTTIDDTEIRNTYDARKSVNRAYKKNSFFITLSRGEKKLTQKIYIPPKPRTVDL